ncbi:NAD(P)-dependent oxidoreductase [Candidatus Pelagibacter sp.]|nr:NAD(P)-dependent oxidoreductase [Candidatus Pelagibacter sp.]
MKKYKDLKKSLHIDLKSVFDGVGKKDWLKLKNKTIFLTGGTGPFGFWLLSSFVFANNHLSLNAKIYVLTRKKKNLIFDIIKDKSIKVVEGDIRDFKLNTKKINYIIHGATTSASETYNKQDPIEKFSILYSGTKRVLRLAKDKKVSNFLFLSSGAVYGNRNKNLKFSEEMEIAPLTNNLNFDLSVLAEAKRSAEILSIVCSKKFKFNVNIARCFSFIGPYMPLKVHYAAGNFLYSSIKTKKIKINGNPLTTRSYMYYSDLATILWKILFSKKNCEIYNVGSDEKINMKNLAKYISQLSKKTKIVTNRHDIKKELSFYVPNIDKLKKHFKIKIKNNFKNSIKKTYLNIISNKKFYGIK